MIGSFRWPDDFSLEKETTVRDSPGSLLLLVIGGKADHTTVVIRVTKPPYDVKSLVDDLGR